MLHSNLFSTTRIPFSAVAAPDKVPGNTRATPTAEFDLHDPKVIEALAKKYAHFATPASLYHKVAEGYATLSAILSHPAFTEAGGVEPTSTTRAQADPGVATRSALSSMKLAERVLDLGQKGVQLTCELPSLLVSVHGLLLEPTGQQQLAFEAGRKLLATMFPDLDLEKLRLTDGRAEVDAKREIPIEAVSSLNVPRVGKLDLSSWDKNFRGIVRYVMTVKSVRCFDDDEPEFIGDHNDFRMTVEVEAIITFPREYALWCTSSTGEDFVPLSFWLHQSRVQHWWGSDEPAGNAPAPRVDHPDAVARKRVELVDKFGLAPLPRVNKEGICSLPNGDLLYVPDSGSSDWTTVLKSCVEPDTGRVNLGAMRGRHVATDWVLNKLYVTDNAGTQRMIDLTGARPVTRAVVGHLMLEPVGNTLGRVLQLCDKLVGSVDRSAVSEAGEELCWNNLIDSPFVADEDSILNRRLFAVGQSISEAYQKLDSSGLSLWEQVYVRPYMALFGPYREGDVLRSCQRAIAERSALNRAAVNTDPSKVQLHDLEGVDGIMPHQIEVDGALSLFPHAAVLDIQAGGGKSFAYIDDVTKLMAAGKIKRPGIAMPRNLMAQFANEVVRFTKGRLRPFIVNNRVWRGWMRRLESNPQAILQLMIRQPKNTFFIVDYGWLTLAPENIGFGEETESFYPYAHIMAQVGFDYFALDESQRAKKLTTGRTIAAAQLSSTAAVSRDGTEGFVRIGSGTIFHNTTRDVLGQMAQLEPTALGSLGDSIKTNGRVVASERPELVERMTRFARRVTVPRRKWAHLLPPILERVHPVSMTKNQQKFYDDWFKNEVERIMADPKIRKLLKQVKEGDEAEGAEARLEVLFKRHISKLEIWINAPDSDFADKNLGVFFRNTSGVSPDDLLSCKIGMIDELCDSHFDGGQVDFGDGKGLVDVPPSKNKIVIVGYNKAVSQHLIKHIKYRDRAVHFKAGDDKVIEDFKTNDKMILVADETALSEGHNLQCADRMIRVQTVFSPGMQEQTLSRVWRPDVPDKDGNVRYQRDHIYLDWIVCEPSIEMAKMARMISKIIENAVTKEADTNKNLADTVERNKEVFGAAKRIRLGLDFLLKKDFQTTDSLYAHFAAYQKYKTWERDEQAEELAKVRRDVEARVGRKVKKWELGPLSMRRIGVDTQPTTMTADFDPDNKLQALGYLPFVDGFTGFNPTKLQLAPLTVIDPDEDDEDAGDSDEEVEENIVVEKGDPVMTEYGPGFVTATRRGSKFLFVLVPGFSTKPIKTLRWCCTAPVDDVSKRALLLMLKSAPKGMPTVRFDDRSGALVPVVSSIPSSTVDNYIKTATKEAEKPAVKGRGREPEAPPPKKNRSEELDKLARKLGVTPGTKGTKTKAPGITRAPGVKKTDPFVGKKPDAKVSRQAEIVKKQKTASRPINLSDESLVTRAKKRLLEEKRLAREAEKDVREIEAAIFNGVVCIMTDDGGDKDPVLLKNGFDRIGRSVRIRVKNPKGYRALVDKLATKFSIPPVNKRALEDFYDVYASQRANIAYLKPKYLPFHAKWLRDQRKKAVNKNEIRPWPVVEDGLVYLYISLETCPAATKLKQFSMPVGVMKPVAVQAGLVAMVKGVNQAKALIAKLEARNIEFTNKVKLIRELKKIRG